MSNAIDLLPPRAGTSSGGGGSGWVELVTAAHDIDAHLLTGRLSEAGIQTSTIKERGLMGAWLLCGSDPWAPVRVLVPRFQLDDARIVLAEVAWASPAVDPETVVAQGRWRRPVVWWTAALFLGLIFTGLALDQAGGMKDCARGTDCAEASPSP